MNQHSPDPSLKTDSQQIFIVWLQLLEIRTQISILSPTSLSSVLVLARILLRLKKCCQKSRISLPLVFSFALEDHLGAYPQVFHAVLPRTAARRLVAPWRSAACVGDAYTSGLAGYFKGCIGGELNASCQIEIQLWVQLSNSMIPWFTCFKVRWNLTHWTVFFKNVWTNKERAIWSAKLMPTTAAINQRRLSSQITSVKLLKGVFQLSPISLHLLGLRVKYILGLKNNRFFSHDRSIVADLNKRSCKTKENGHSMHSSIKWESSSK